jgi:5,10-methylene-tetrahydrofolate dehydrogenase/Methenyl tetrahydrofolate cyclohydrolase
LRRRHPERSEAKSKDPVNLPFGFATGFLDFARNDKHKLWQKLIDGRAIAEKVYADLRRDIAELKAKGVRQALPWFSWEMIRLRALMCVRKTKCAANLGCTQ